MSLGSSPIIIPNDGINVVNQKIGGRWVADIVKGFIICCWDTRISWTITHKVFYRWLKRFTLAPKFFSFSLNLSLYYNNPVYIVWTHRHSDSADAARFALLKESVFFLRAKPPNLFVYIEKNDGGKCDDDYDATPYDDDKTVVMRNMEHQALRCSRKIRSGATVMKNSPVADAEHDGSEVGKYSSSSISNTSTLWWPEYILAAISGFAGEWNETVRVAAAPNVIIIIIIVGLESRCAALWIAGDVGRV